MPADPIIPPVGPKAAEKGGPEAAKLELTVPAATGATVDEKIRFEADLLAYQALSESCARLRRRVDECVLRGEKPVSGKQAAAPVQLIILDEASSAIFEVEAAFHDQATNLQQAFTSIQEEVGMALRELGETPGEGISGPPKTAAKTAATFAVPAALTAALSLFKAFQTETAYFGRSVAVSRRALELELAHQWERRADVAVFVSDLAPGTGATQKRGDVQGVLNSVIAARAAAFKAIHELSTAMRKIEPKNEKYPFALLALNWAKEQFEGADSIMRDFSAKLATADPMTKLNTLQVLERANRFRCLLKQQDKRTFFLFVESVVAGGSYRTIKNLWRSLFWADGVEVAAGVLLVYGLFGGDGRLVSSGLVPSGKGFLTLKKIWEGMSG